MDALRLYLLAGLVAHKLVWRLLERRQCPTWTAPQAPISPVAPLLKGLKLAILAGLVVQTLTPDVLPISANPTAMRVAGALLFTAGLAIAVLGRVQLGDNWSDIESAQVLRRQAVVDTGIYRYVRHPIYGGDLLLLFGFQLSVNSWFVLGVLLTIPYVAWRAIREETMLAQALPGYAAYCARTRRFLPFVV